MRHKSYIKGEKGLSAKISVLLEMHVTLKQKKQIITYLHIYQMVGLFMCFQFQCICLIIHSSRRSKIYRVKKIVVVVVEEIVVVVVIIIISSLKIYVKLGANLLCGNTMYI